MGLLNIIGNIQDVINGKKLKKPDILKAVNEEESQLTELKSLLDEVSDDQKESIQNELYKITRGLKGEKNIEYELKNSDLPLISLHDINLEHDGRASQIDFVVITTKCIIVIESKNLYGEIRIDNDNFIRVLRSKENNTYKQERIYNPVSQNEKHITLLKHLIEDKLGINDLPLFSLVVFSDASTMVNTKYANNEIKKVVINHDNLKNKITKLMELSTTQINVTTCYKIAEMLLNNDKGYKSYYINKLDLKLNKKEENTENSIRENNENVDNDLYNELKNWRYQKSQELNVKPYYIFSNEVLSDLIIKLPKDAFELLNVYGFGETKVKEYGDEILKIINGENYISNNGDDINLYNELCKWRKARANRFDIDEDYICTDEVLKNVSKTKPITKEDLISATNFDEKRYKYNGEEMIEIIKKYK